MGERALEERGMREYSGSRKKLVNRGGDSGRWDIGNFEEIVCAAKKLLPQKGSIWVHIFYFLRPSSVSSICKEYSSISLLFHVQM